MEKKESNRSKSNFYTKEESILYKRRQIMKEVLQNLQLNNSYNDRQKEIEEYINKSKKYKSLNLTVASSSLHFSKTIFSITPNGLIDKDYKNIKDGIMLFGYESNSHIEEEIEEENNKHSSIYDFIFPIENENSLYLCEFPSFCIYFDTKDENYYIKDFSVGIGALMKIKKYKIGSETLINIGANYLVINIKDDDITIKIFNNSILEKNTEQRNFDIKNFKINKKEDKLITIGRNKKCDVIIEDMMMSKIQCCIKYNSKDKAFYLYDGNSVKESMNGTWVYILNPIKITDNFTFKAEHTLFVIKIIYNDKKD